MPLSFPQPALFLRSILYRHGITHCLFQRLTFPLSDNVCLDYLYFCRKLYIIHSHCYIQLCEDTVIIYLLYWEWGLGLCRSGLSRVMLLWIFWCTTVSEHALKLRCCQTSFQSRVPTYTPTRGTGEFQFWRSVSICLCFSVLFPFLCFVLAILVGVHCYHIVVQNCTLWW